MISSIYIQGIEKKLYHKLKKKEYQDLINCALEFIEKKRGKKKSETTMVMYYLAQAYENINSFNEAIKFYNEVLIQHPKIDKFHISVLINIARAYEKISKTKEAIAHYLIVLENDENNIDALYSLGKIHYKNGNIKKCLDYFERLLIIKPSILDARKFYAKALIDSGFYLPALTQLEFLLKYYYEDYETFYLKAKTLEKLKNFSDAIKTYKIFLKRNFDEGKTLEKVLTANILDLKESAKIDIVRDLIKLKKFNECINIINEYLSKPAKEETKLELLYLYGNVLWNIGEEFKALKNFERIYLMKPDFKDVALFYEKYKKLLPHNFLSNYYTNSIEKGKETFENVCKKIIGREDFKVVYKSPDYYIFTRGPFGMVFFRHIEPLSFNQLTDIEMILDNLPLLITNVEIYSIMGIKNDAKNHFLLKKSHIVEGEEFIKTIRSIS